MSIDDDFKEITNIIGKKKINKQIIIPTDDSIVKMKLRELQEPICNLINNLIHKK